MDDRTRRDLGLICIGAVLLAIGTLGGLSIEDPEPLADTNPVETVLMVMAVAGFWVCVISLVRIGVRLVRARD